MGLDGFGKPARSGRERANRRAVARERATAGRIRDHVCTRPDHVDNALKNKKLPRSCAVELVVSAGAVSATRT